MSSIKDSAKSGLSKSVEKATGSPLFLLAAGGVVFFGGRFIIKKAKNLIGSFNQKTIENQVDNKKDPRYSYAVEYAQRLQAAMDGWGTDEDAMYKVAREMKARNVPYSMVADAYRKVFSKNLTTDINDDLASDEVAKFYSYLRGLAAFSGNDEPSEVAGLSGTLINMI